MNTSRWLVCLLAVLSLLLVACSSSDDGDGSQADDDLADDDAGDDDTNDDDANDDDTSDDDTGDDDTSDDDIDDDDTEPPPTSPGYVYVPAGSFNMGSPAGELGHRFNENQHQVTLTRHFEMKETEVTQAEFEEVMGYNPHYYPPYGDGDMMPIESITWYDAAAYANRISAAAGYDPCYVLADIQCEDETTGDTDSYCANNGGISKATLTLNEVDTPYECAGFRLPTEAEWEYAARAGTTAATYNGDPTLITCDPVDQVIDEIAVFCGNSNKSTQPVKQKVPNDWGLYDMIGNVAEWTWDWYENDLTGPAIDPAGPADGHFRVLRGSTARYMGAVRNRAAFRTGHTPDFRWYLNGVRPVRTLPPETPAQRPSPVFAPPAAEQDRAVVSKDWPNELPFEFTRPAVGDPLTPEEITTFTQKVTAFYKASYYVQRLQWIGYGMSADNGQGWPDYKLQIGDSTASKLDGVVTISQTGPSDNLMIPTGKLFANIAAAYLVSADEDMRQVLVSHAKGIQALIWGLTFTDNDPEPMLMPRTPFPANHSYTEEGGRETVIDYDPIKQYKFDWNGWTIPNEYNPYFGETTWVRNMRSKDDVPHIYRVVPWLMRLSTDAVDEDVRETAAGALDALTEFARDIVDTGYYIRTKDEWGNTFIPWNIDYPRLVNDLASFEAYTDLLPSAECDPRLASALIAYGEPLGVDCGNGIGWIYEIVASYQHYFNWAIIRYFHVAAAHIALMTENNDVAYDLLEGLARRADDMMAGFGNWEDWPEFEPDQAAYLLAMATVGLPLTNEEARLIRDQFTAAVDWYDDWGYYDPWDPSVPDGTFPQRPSRDIAPDNKTVRWEELIFLLEYCGSPFRNPTSAEVVDCETVLDPALW